MDIDVIYIDEASDVVERGVCARCSHLLVSHIGWGVNNMKAVPCKGKKNLLACKDVQCGCTEFAWDNLSVFEQEAKKKGL